MAAEDKEVDGAALEERVTPIPRKKKRRKPILTPGQVLANSYEIVEQIGEGGMAIVYKARQRSLNRFVAVKALHPKLARDKEFIERFEAESGALAALSHPNIIGIIDRGSQDEVYYFVMEFVDGEDLDQKIIGNKLTPNDWRQVVTACSSALDYVHKRGVVHRDIKPSNILVDSEGRVKIGDFGIAHIIGGDTLEEGEDESTPRGTGANRAVGTAHYMAPEQMNDPSHIDHRADIFSLAVAFYKMMTRQLPIGEFPAPSEANPEIPVAVDEVIFRALSYSRDDRHQSVQEFCDQLSKALKDQTVSITSILNYRSRTPVSTLYSGADFSKTSSPAGSSSSEVKKPKSDTGIRKNTTGTGTTGASKRGSSTTNAKKPKMGSGRVTVSSDLTPLPVDPSSGANPTVKAPAKGNKTLLVIVAVLLISGLGLLAAVVLNGNERNTAAAPVEPPPPGEIKSEAILREERLEKAREEKRKELLRGSITGDTTQSTPASNQ